MSFIVKSSRREAKLGSSFGGVIVGVGVCVGRFSVSMSVVVVVWYFVVF